MASTLSLTPEQLAQLGSFGSLSGGSVAPSQASAASSGIAIPSGYNSPGITDTSTGAGIGVGISGTGGYTPTYGGGTTIVEGDSTSLNPSAQAQAAASARAAQLRGATTSLIQQIKDLFNTRYGQVDAAARDAAKLREDQYAKDSADLVGQANDLNNQVGASAAASGTYDSSYRANNQDTISKDASNQIEALGTALTSDKATIGNEAQRQKDSFTANKASLDSIAAQIAASTDVNELTSLKATLEKKLQDLSAGGADYNTQEQNLASLKSIVPTNAQGVQLKTTLARVATSNLDPAMKMAMGQKVVMNSGLSPDEQQKLLQAFQGDVGSTDKTQTA